MSDPALPFGATYARLYDAIYADKDYAGEIDIVERCFERHGALVKRVLELGCGTGRHTAELARRGYRVFAVDRSASMLFFAKERCKDFEQVCLIEAPIERLELGQCVDAALLLFAVLSYQPGAHAALAALRSVRASLKDGGLLVGDVWHGPAVLEEPPEHRSRTVTRNGETWVREVNADHRPLEQRVTVRYRVGRVGTEMTEEAHELHYFFPAELRLLVELAGFELLSLTAVDDLDVPPSASRYAALFVARAI